MANTLNIQRLIDFLADQKSKELGMEIKYVILPKGKFLEERSVANDN